MSKRDDVRLMLVQPRHNYEVTPGHTFGPNAPDDFRMSIYIECLPRLVGADLADRVRWVWRCLATQYNPLPLPICGQHGGAAFQFAWNRPGVYLDLEIQHDGLLAWTWIDRVAGTCEGEEGKANFSEFCRPHEGAQPVFFDHLEAIGAKPYMMPEIKMPKVRGPTKFLALPGIGLIKVER